MDLRSERAAKKRRFSERPEGTVADGSNRCKQGRARSRSSERGRTPAAAILPRVTRLEPRGSALPPLTFHVGAHPPYAIRWFGITSLFGHAQHFAASAIANESVDSRDWMRPSTASELLAETLAVLGRTGGAGASPDLVTGLGREL